MPLDFRDDLLQSYSDAELAHYITSSPRLSPISNIFLLSATLLAKHYKPSVLEDTVKAIEIARQRGIRVPCIKRTIEYEGSAYCIMERIQGSTLEDAWTKLGWFTILKLALQLRSFVNPLRIATSSTAGSLASGECRSFWLEDYFGLPVRSSPGNIASFTQFWASFTSMRKATQATAPVSIDSNNRIPPMTKAFLFTHHDLAPRNILLSPSGQLWLLDWDYAGFYPIYFEYASMQNFHVPQDWDLFARLRWHVFTWIAAGRYERSARILRQIRSRSTRFAVGRRFELLKHGEPSRRPVS